MMLASRECLSRHSRRSRYTIPPTARPALAPTDAPQLKRVRMVVDMRALFPWLLGTRARARLGSRPRARRRPARYQRAWLQAEQLDDRAH